VYKSGWSGLFVIYVFNHVFSIVSFTRCFHRGLDLVYIHDGPVRTGPLLSTLILEGIANGVRLTLVPRYY
jgi:hypothetical protein